MDAPLHYACSHCRDELGKGHDEVVTVIDADGPTVAELAKKCCFCPIRVASVRVRTMARALCNYREVPI